MDLRAVAFRDRGKWIAQCLERDLCTSADTYDRLAQKLCSRVTQQAELDSRPCAAVVHREAPRKFWRMFEDGDMEEILMGKGHSVRLRAGSLPAMDLVEATSI